MSQLVIEVDTPEDEALMMQLLPRLNAKLVGKQDEDVQKPSFIEIA